MATKFTLMENTAYPESQMRAMFLEEILRRLRNCTPAIHKKEKGEHLTEFAMTMKMTGQQEAFRKSVFKQAVKRYEKELYNHYSGVEDMYRSRSDRRRQMRERGVRKGKDDWYKNQLRTSMRWYPRVFWMIM